MHVSKPTCLRPSENEFAEASESLDVDQSCFVRPLLLEDGTPVVMPLQQLVNQMDSEAIYEAPLYCTSTAKRPLPLLKGHARVILSEGRVQVWRGALEILRPQRRGFVGSVRLDAADSGDDYDSGSKEGEEDGEDNPLTGLTSLIEVAATIPDDRGSSSDSSENAARAGEEDDMAERDNRHEHDTEKDQDIVATDQHAASSDYCQDDVVQETQAESAIVRTIHPQTIADWHCFRLTWRAGKKPAWQATCPYHKTSFTGTPCKKTYMIGADTAMSALRKLKPGVLLLPNITATTHMAQSVQPTTATDEDLDEGAAALRAAQGQG